MESLLSFWDVETAAPKSAVVDMVDGSPIAELAVTENVDPQIEDDVFVTVQMFIKHLIH